MKYWLFHYLTFRVERLDQRVFLVEIFGIEMITLGAHIDEKFLLWELI